MEGYYTLEELMAIFDVQYLTVLKWVRSGHVVTTRAPGKRSTHYVPKDSAHKLIPKRVDALGFKLASPGTVCDIFLGLTPQVLAAWGKKTVISVVYLPREEHMRYSPRYVIEEVERAMKIPTRHSRRMYTLEEVAPLADTTPDQVWEDFVKHKISGAHYPVGGSAPVVSGADARAYLVSMLYR